MPYQYRRRRRVIRRVTRSRASGYAKARSRRTYGYSRPKRYRPVSKKRILNVASRKKSDTMLTWVSDNNGNQAPGAIVIPGDEAVPQIYVWSPTMRGMTVGDSKFAVSTANRTSSETYAVGLAERISLTTNDSASWLWRRICFTTYGSYIWTVEDQTYFPIIAGGSPAGYQRAFVSLGGATVPTIQDTLRAQLYGQLFQGVQGVDYSETNLAKTKSRGITVMYDKTVRIESGNEHGVYRTYKRWHPMRKRLTYLDVEDGPQLDSSLLSVADRRSMGDYYVLDLFTCSDNDSEHTLTVNADATYYWHER